MKNITYAVFYHVTMTKIILIKYFKYCCSYFRFCLYLGYKIAFRFLKLLAFASLLYLNS